MSIILFFIVALILIYATIRILCAIVDSLATFMVAAVVIAGIGFGYVGCNASKRSVESPATMQATAHVETLKERQHRRLMEITNGVGVIEDDKK